MRIYNNRKNAELDKINLERQKLDEEIKILQKRWYNNIHHLPAIATILVAIIGLVFTFTSGLFDAQRANLQNEKSILTLEILNFKKEKDSIKSLVKVSKRALDSLKRENENLKKKSLAIIKQINFIKLNYSVEKKGIAKELVEINKLLEEKKLDLAYKKLSELTQRLNNFTGRTFSIEFAPEFGSEIGSDVGPDI